jgi:hypothetical protein
MKCPHCDCDLTAVTGGCVIRGRAYDAELQTFECPAHGTVFLTREGLPGTGGPASAADVDGDIPVRDPRPSPRRPVTGSVAVPEPDEP